MNRKSSVPSRAFWFTHVSPPPSATHPANLPQNLHNGDVGLALLRVVADDGVALHAWWSEAAAAVLSVQAGAEAGLESARAGMQHAVGLESGSYFGIGVRCPHPRS